MTRFCFKKLFQISENKIAMHTMIVHCWNVYEAYIELNTEQTENIKNS